MQYDWAIARYGKKSEQGKHAMALASEGMGYHIIDIDNNPNGDVFVAFKFALTKPLPHHLAFATPHQRKKIEEKELKRKGVAYS